MDFVTGVVKSSRNNVVRVRETPSTTARILRMLRVGDEIRYSPEVVVGGDYEINKEIFNTWFQLEDGFVATNVLTIGVVEEKELPLCLLNVPFISQIDNTSKRTNNDCGVACALMLIQYTIMRSGLKMMRALTVDKLVEDTSLKMRDIPLTLTAVVNLMEDYGLSPKIIRPLNPEAIVKKLDESTPAILLVNYRHIGMGAFGHYVVAHGYSEGGFFVHDPYKQGANLFVPREKLDLALTDTSTFAAFTYQGIVA